MEHIDDKVDIYCPHCRCSQEIEDDNWDFIDDEQHIIICEDCKQKYIVRVQRPITYDVGKIIKFV